MLSSNAGAFTLAALRYLGLGSEYCTCRLGVAVIDNQVV